jgi:hypothetical protein
MPAAYKAEASILVRSHAAGQARRGLPESAELLRELLPDRSLVFIVSSLKTPMTWPHFMDYFARLPPLLILEGGEVLHSVRKELNGSVCR